jgi:stage II sporulation protein D
MRLQLITILLCVNALVTNAQSIKIAIFNDKEINSLTVNVKQGRYLLKRGDEVMGEYKKGEIFHITRFNNTIEVRDKHNFIGNFQTVEFNCTLDDGILDIKPVSPLAEEREYDDNLVITISNSRLKLINRLDMEKYIASVIEAEGGNHAPAEYYKAQAVLIRTFTIKNLFKHAEEGFDLCDGVHCQAYKGRCSQNPEILMATQSTAGKVLLDQEDILIMSPFHSNCGGITSPAGAVWQEDLSYLRSVNDPFCTKSTQALWTVTVSRSEWLSFISSYTNNNINYQRYNFSFNTPSRSKSILINGIELNLRTVRERFNLRSTLFSISDEGESIVFNGRGYGHGVGMCQEGAMEMARVGYSWLDILHFYFYDVKLADYREMDLHRYKAN